MAKNPLKNTPQAFEDRSKWTLAEHCAAANRRVIETGVNEQRRREGFGPVQWIVRDGRLAITDGAPQLQIAIPQSTTDSAG